MNQKTASCVIFRFPTLLISLFGIYLLIDLLEQFVKMMRLIVLPLKVTLWSPARCCFQVKYTINRLCCNVIYWAPVQVGHYTLGTDVSAPVNPLILLCSRAFIIMQNLHFLAHESSVVSLLWLGPVAPNKPNNTLFRPHLQPHSNTGTLTPSLHTTLCHSLEHADTVPTLWELINSVVGKGTPPLGQLDS